MFVFLTKQTFRNISVFVRSCFVHSGEIRRNRLRVEDKERESERIRQELSIMEQEQNEKNDRIELYGSKHSLIAQKEAELQSRFISETEKEPKLMYWPITPLTYD